MERSGKNTERNGNCRVGTKLLPRTHGSRKYAHANRRRRLFTRKLMGSRLLHSSAYILARVKRDADSSVYTMMMMMMTIELEGTTREGT